MKPTFTLLAFIALFSFLSFTSCDSSEEITPTAVEPITSEAYLNLSYHPPVFFQYALHNAETDELQGFLIDKAGEIRTYQFSEAPYEYKQLSSIPVLRPRIENLLNISQSTGQYVDLDSFAGHVKDIRRSGSHLLESAPGQDNAQITQTYYAYGPGSIRTSQHSCQTGDSSPTTTGFTQILLSSSGKEVLTSASRFSPAIVEWLEEIDRGQVISLTSAN